MSESEANYYSQAGEDRWIAENLKALLPALPAVGTFAEIGAFDGIMSSNTLHFEQHGWKGFCVEADPHTAARCAQNRQAITVCCACANTYGIYPFHVNDEDHGLSGCVRPGRRIFTGICRLDWMCETLGFKKLDLLSIDTEGTELDVWESGRPGIRPTVIIMEYQTCDLPPVDGQIITQMTADGYALVHKTAHNLIFTRK